MSDLASLRNARVADLASRCRTQEHAKASDEAAKAVRKGGSLPAGDDTNTTLARLSAVHELLSAADVSRTSTAALREYGNRLLYNGQLLAHALPEMNVGALVVCRQAPARPLQVPDTAAGLFPHLRAVPLAAWQDSRRLVLDTHLAFPLSGAGLVIACLPWLTGPDDVDLVRADQGEISMYHGSPVAAELRDHVRDALAALDASGAHVAVLPELALDDELLAAWRAACLDIEPIGPLTLILLGSGPVSEFEKTDAFLRDPAGSPNRAVAVRRDTGEIVLVQDKQHGYTMQEKWRGAEVFAGLGTGTLSEVVAAPSGINVLVTGAGDAIAVLICEDLGRPVMQAGAAVDLGVSLVLTPILAEPIPARPRLEGDEMVGVRKWMDVAADAMHTEGCAVVVVNSFAAGRLDPSKGDRSCLAYWPGVAELPKDWTGHWTPTADADTAPPVDARKDALTPRVLKLGD